MANINAALHRIRQARRRLDAPPPKHFDDYRPEYEAILEATDELDGESGFDALLDWMLQTTKDRKRLPGPDAVRAHAHELCAARDIAVPANSRLRDAFTS